MNYTRLDKPWIRRGGILRKLLQLSEHLSNLLWYCKGRKKQ